MNYPPAAPLNEERCGRGTAALRRVGAFSERAGEGAVNDGSLVDDGLGRGVDVATRSSRHGVPTAVVSLPEGILERGFALEEVLDPEEAAVFLGALSMTHRAGFNLLGIDRDREVGNG